MGRKVKQLILIILTLSVLALVLINAYVFDRRVDATESGIYTVSKVTKDKLRGLEDKVKITYFLSRDLETKYEPVKTIVDILEGMAAKSKGKMLLEIDMVDTNKHQLSQSMQQKLKAVSISINEGTGKRTQVAVYSGFKIEYLGKTEYIDFEATPEIIEYRLLSTISKMTDDKAMKIGIVNGFATRGDVQINPQAQDPQEIQKLFSYSILLKSLAEKDFPMDRLTLDSPIPSDYNAVIVLGSEIIDESAILVLDQYMMKGGSVLFLVEKNDMTINSNPYMGMQFSAVNRKDLPIFSFLEHFGIKISDGVMMDGNAMMFPFDQQQQQQQQSGTIRLSPYPYWPLITNQNKKAPVNNNFSEIALLWPSTIEINDAGEADDDSSATEYEVLLRSGKNSILIDNPDPSALGNTAMAVANFKGIDAGERGKKAVAVKVSGNLESYFNTNPVPTREGEDALFSNLKKSTDTGQFIVLSDADFISDMVAIAEQQNRFFASGAAANNFSYFRNLVEYLGGDKDLLNLRTRVYPQRKLNGIADPKAKEAYIAFIQIFNLLIPVIVLIFALIWLLLRNHRVQGNKSEKKLKKSKKGATK